MRLRSRLLVMAMRCTWGDGSTPNSGAISMTSKRDLKRINNPDDVMSMPYSLIATRQRFNIYAGNY